MTNTLLFTAVAPVIIWCTEYEGNETMVGHTL